MPIKLSYIMRKSDWVKLAILLLVASIAFSHLYGEYQEAEGESQRILDVISEY